MTTIDQSAQSSYFPSCNRGQQNHLSHLQAKRTTLVSFPKTRQALWDSDKVGTDMTLHLSSTRNVTIQIVEKTLRLAYQHAVHANSIHFNSFLVGTVETLADEEGITVILNRFDPGRDLPGCQDRTLTAKLPGDFVAPVCFSFQDGDQTLTHREKDFMSAFKYLDHSIGSRECVDLNSTLSVRIHCLCYEGTDDITLSVHVGAVIVATPIEMGPINSIPIIPTALARNLAGPISLSQLHNNHKFGLITMDQTRKLLLLLETDPKAYALPLIGIWVSGVNYIHSPVILTACLKFLFSRSIQDRALSPTGGFVLLLYSPIHKHPLFYECKIGNSAEGMTFDLIGCKDQLHLYKHGDGSGMSDVQLELTAARDGPSKELFLQTLKQYQLKLRPKNSGRKASIPEITAADPHLVPRPSPKPTLTKSPTVIPAVPEVSLIFDNVENKTPTRKMLHPSLGYKRPGPLRELNQSSTQLEQRKSGLISSDPQFSKSKSGKNHVKGHTGMVENDGVTMNGSLPLQGVRMGELRPVGFGQQQNHWRESLQKSDERVGDNEPLLPSQYPGNDPKQHKGGQQCMPVECETQRQSMIRGRRKSHGLKGVEANRTFPLDYRQADGILREKQQTPTTGQRQPHQWQHSLKQHGQQSLHQGQHSIQHRQHSPAESQHMAQQRECSPQHCQHAIQQRQQSPHESQHTTQQIHHSPQQNHHMVQQRQDSPQHSQHTAQCRQPSPQQSQHTMQEQFSPQDGQFSPTQEIQQTSIKQNMSDSLQRDSVREEPTNRANIHPLSGGEDSAFTQLKKQEKMIEALQEQIRYLLQLQAGSPGLMTPPATPPSIPGQTSFPFPSPQETSEKRQPPISMLPLSQSSPSNAPHQVTSGRTSLSNEGVHHNGEGPHKQMTTISTNTGQSLFFHNQRDPPLRQDDGPREMVQRTKLPAPFDTPPKQSEKDSRGITSTTDSSVQGSVSDSALSAEPEFQLDLENTRDDTESLGKVELTSYPDSGSMKSSPDGSPTRHQHPHHSTTSPSQSPGSGHNTTIVTPKMPTLVSPVLGESASTCQPASCHHHMGSRRTSPQGVTDIPAISEESNGEEEETESALPDDRIQTPSLLCRDQRKFYQNLLGQVENFLQEDNESDGEGKDEESCLEERDASSSEDEETSEEDGQLQTPRGMEKSVLLRSLFCSPDFHPHINYVSLAEFGIGPSDISVEADAIAMKYLSDDELAKISSDLKHNRIQEDSVNPLLRTVLTAGLPPHLANEKSMIKSRVEFSFATRKYLERHGLGDTTLQDDGLCSEEDEGNVSKGKRNQKKKKRKKRILHRKKSEAAEVVFPMNTGGKGGIEEHLNGEVRSHEVCQGGETIGNILDWNKLKNLPKLF
ncbi:SCL-interrupting locus protein-like [Holothuria leucospilota]|uniref:SCL-interrupting locus protein-like n=1 Tax=Holothuria leucospilota TaxID=206669 RepID=A0A9Q1C745_HOLLE|nr:SCL-interrupting locus protein-like [Holothuria leucospilota]